MARRGLDCLTASARKEPAVADLSTVTLPVLPLRNGVVFPHMVVTVTIESDEAKRAVAAAESSGGKLILVPRIEGEYAAVGTIADIQEV